MSIFDSLLNLFPPAKAAKGIIQDVAGVLGIGNDDPKLKQLEPLVQQKIIERDEARDAEAEKTARTVYETRAKMVVAEMQHGTKFVKNARPGVVVGGFVVYLLEFCLRAYLLLTTGDMPDATVTPEPMIYAHLGIASVWFGGRTVEKKAKEQGRDPGKWIQMITGGMG